MLEEILGELEPRTIGRRIEQPHLRARSDYLPPTMRPCTYSDFAEILGDYYAYHLSRCITRGANISHAEARSVALEIVEKCYRQNGENLLLAYQDAYYGTNGGLRRILNLLATEIRNDSVRYHVRDVFDRWAPPPDWEGQVDLVREFLRRFGDQLPPYLRKENPARYARNSDAVIQTYSKAFEDMRRWIDITTP